MTFDVLGTPVPKGSTRAFAIPVKGTGGKKWRAVTTSANPNMRSWSDLVRQTAMAELKKLSVPMQSVVLMNAEPVDLELVFWIVRPPSVSVKSRAYPVVKPDLDKLTRTVLDALAGVLYRDDAQVVRTVAVKEYVSNRPAGVRITVRPYEMPVDLFLPMKD